MRFQSHRWLVTPWGSVCNRFDVTSEANLQVLELLSFRETLALWKLSQTTCSPCSTTKQSYSVDWYQLFHNNQRNLLFFWERTKTHLLPRGAWWHEEKMGSSSLYEQVNTLLKRHRTRPWTVNHEVTFWSKFWPLSLFVSVWVWVWVSVCWFINQFQ